MKRNLTRTQIVNLNITSSVENIILDPEDVTPGRLNALGMLPEVSGVTVILAKELPVSNVYRLASEYVEAAAARAHPQTLFLKLNRTDMVAVVAQNITSTEVEFYKKAAPEMDCPPLVRCYSAGYDKPAGRSYIEHFEPPIDR